ncbi:MULTISPECIES: aldehyde dehydrogenase [Pseudomonadaceae]|jgi:acyl-CoA reductase-like NAD-dependent aldehyde dehydrogenase|uniref:Salicylaldehyde dehydrogenase n=11 Tax=Gammaproteobacteria TaxID=1236 RepID=A0A653BBL3_ECTOL|nr:MULTISPECIES: aldehyde dehydrogenase [Pseudomonadaceae]MAL90206.1 dehydrogenase [Pseudomonas sp.]MDP9687685.1 acyl-CoA reductase-like NAD-dependent aldehyde dehydrogenase [Pseudomonas mohnii]OHC70860.1 MAG: dehydrogenase [Pseudomonadales bacterium RIFCSPLOWO2_02_FULL_63_210]CAE6924472.1 Salicylaldehyde dehydrogenase [Pseudomonas oleovorans]AHC35725.1 salicylaldehyde dehydrogenase [Pseudomonas sp. TKP]|tara:strand:+ start:3650 stop:5101 length:1452 start_codon:yes stop_codon:yes gene_type:complete
MSAQLVIDNIKLDATGGKTIQRLDPVSAKLVSTAAACTLEDAKRLAASSERAFRKWSKTGPTERRRLLLAAADVLEAKMSEFCRIMAEEIGASQLWAQFNVGASANLLREAAALTTQIKGETIPTDKLGAFSLTLRQPVGTVLSIVPWNGPVILGARAIAYPLACGNTVIFKGSENSPRTHALVADAFIEAGLPAGVLNFLITAPEDASAVTEALVAHDTVRRVNFTGSTKVGRMIAETCASHLKRCLLELGGKAPFVVLEDADIDGAVNAAVFGSFLYQGQICMSTERFVVDQRVADEFVSKFSERIGKLELGDPTASPTCVVGPVIAQGSVKRINHLIEDALGKGAVIAAGGIADSALMQPTLVDRVTKDMEIYDEETFGPITTIVRVDGAEEALEVANDTAYGLSSAIFSANVSKALELASRLDAGCVHINGATVQNEAQAPYGGMKQSGYGRFDGSAVIDEFTEIKWVTVEPSDQPYPF